MKLSILVPTYNQEKILPKSLEAIFNQSLAKSEYEVLVINDGSTDNTGKVILELGQRHSFRYFKNKKNKGAAATRNLGIKNAKNEIVVFLQDDVIADFDFLKEHLKVHQKNPGEEVGMVGFTTWHPDLNVTPFMDWLEHGGPQFDYDRIKGKRKVDFQAFYTSNLSLKRNFLLKDGLFDEEFFKEGMTAYEDTELGYRLEQKGMKLLYNPEAKAYHYHPKTLKSVCKRRIVEGEKSVLFSKKHPGFKMKGAVESFRHNLTHLKTGFLSDRTRFLLTNWFLNKITIWPLERSAYFCETRVNIPILYKIVCGFYYNVGYKKGRRKYQRSLKKFVN